MSVLLVLAGTIIVVVGVVLLIRVAITKRDGQFQDMIVDRT
jgi:hypothetical protein